VIYAGRVDTTPPGKSDTGMSRLSNGVQSMKNFICQHSDLKLDALQDAQPVYTGKRVNQSVYLKRSN